MAARANNAAELLVLGNGKKKKNPAELLIFGNPKKLWRVRWTDDGRVSRAFSTKEEAEKLLAYHQKKDRRTGMVETVSKKKNAGGGFGNHKPGCKCAFCKRAAQLTGGKKNSSKRETRERASRIRAARLNPKKQKRATPRKRRTDRRIKKEKVTVRLPRRNPSETEEAVRLFESFHGKDPKEIAEKHVSAAMRLDYAALGDLMKLRIKSPLGELYELDFEGEGVKLASSPDGKQLYCIGGRQNIEKCLDADSLQKDFIDLGECVRVEYFARKIHSNYQPITYYHKMGEKTGDRPTLMYDKLRKQIFFIGGAYHIDKDKGISPGIEN